jgi:hypothetical protein
MMMDDDDNGVVTVGAYIKPALTFELPSINGLSQILSIILLFLQFCLNITNTDSVTDT